MKLWLGNKLVWLKCWLLAKLKERDNYPCCATCKHWALIRTANTYQVGRCQLPTPACYQRTDRKNTFNDDGTDCPRWEAPR